MCAIIYPMQGVQTSIYSKLAGQAVHYYVSQQGFLPVPENLSFEFDRQQACYVTILENPGRRVRSIYGQVLPQKPLLAQEIIFNTVNAVIANPTRKLSKHDLPHLRYSVSLLGPLQRVSDLEHLNPARFGLYIKSDRGKLAVLLPRRAGVETAQDQLATALREAGINSRQEAVNMYRFDVVHFDE